MIPAYNYPFRNPITAINCMSDFIDICNSFNIPHFFIMGTALGLYRNSNFIPLDNDIDVFIKVDKKPPETLINAMVKKGFYCNTIPGALQTHNIHFLRNGILLDVWFKNHPNFMRNFNTPHYINFKGLNAPVPDHIEEYLTVVYGDWKTPANISANAFKGIPADQIRKK